MPPQGPDVVAPYDAPMDVGAVVTPPRVARPLRLLPFRGLSLAATRIGDPASARAFARPYRDVADRFQRLERRGQVTHDDAPAVYLHEYTAGGVTVRGLVGALDISRPAATWDDVAVLPHEGIHPAQADELADRMAQMEFNPAPILLVHRGPADARALLRRVQTRTPYLDFSDRGRQQHRVWAVRDPAELAILEAALAPSRALIADGHHRFAAYHRLRQQHPGAATDLGLAMLVDQEDTPLFLGAIHRVLSGVTLEALRAAGRATFVETTAEVAVAALRSDVLAATDGHHWATLGLDLPADRAAVEVLHEELVPGLPRAPSAIGYHHTVENALAAVGRRAGVAILMPAPDFGLVLRIASAGRLLPEKATSFQPKPSVGVLIRSLRDG
jgi:uncharacterized protein (DUF1015 family)